MSSVSGDDIVLDFFAGSGTTGHAVVAENYSDSGNRRFVLVQIPEPIVEGSPAATAGFQRISEVTTERIRKAENQIVGAKEKNSSITNQNSGFRFFRLDESNFAVWDANAIEGDESKLEQQLFAQVEHV